MQTLFYCGNIFDRPRCRYKPVISMKQSPLEAICFSATQEISCTQRPISVFSESAISPYSEPFNSVNALPTYFYSILILSSYPRPKSSKWSLSLTSSHRNPVFIALFPHTCDAHSSSYIACFDRTNTSSKQ